MPTFGEVLGHEVKTRHARPMPFQKERPIQVTAIYRTGSIWEPPRRETQLFWGSFGSVMARAQARWPGAQLRISTLDTVPVWIKAMQENARLAEEQMSTMVEGQES
jgi:hypothetical protein